MAFQLPEWFDLSFYRKHTTLKHWCLALVQRETLWNDAILNREYRDEVRDEFFHQHLAFLGTDHEHVICSVEIENQEKLVPINFIRGEHKSDLLDIGQSNYFRSVRDMQASDLDGHSTHKKRSSRFLPIHDCGEEISKLRKTYVKKAPAYTKFAKVDLNATDETLVADFQDWLKEKRRTVENHPPPSKITDTDLRKWKANGFYPDFSDGFIKT